MSILVVCTKCRKRMAARDADKGRQVKCSGCGQVLLAPAAAWDGAREKLVPPPQADPGLEWAEDYTLPERQLEHLRVIRLYLGWLLVIAAVPAVCTAALLVLWLAARAAASASNAGV